MFGVSKVAAELWKAVNSEPEEPQQQSFNALFQLRAEIAQPAVPVPRALGLVCIGVACFHLVSLRTLIYDFTGFLLPCTQVSSRWGRGGGSLSSPGADAPRDGSVVWALCLVGFTALQGLLCCSAPAGLRGNEKSCR